MVINRKKKGWAGFYFSLGKKIKIAWWFWCFMLSQESPRCSSSSQTYSFPFTISRRHLSLILNASCSCSASSLKPCNFLTKCPELFSRAFPLLPAFNRWGKGPSLFFLDKTWGKTFDWFSHLKSTAEVEPSRFTHSPAFTDMSTEPSQSAQRRLWGIPHLLSVRFKRVMWESSDKTEVSAHKGTGCSYQSCEEGHSQMPEVIVQQSAVHHVPEDSNASWLTQRVSCRDTKKHGPASLKRTGSSKGATVGTPATKHCTRRRK